jgi:CBS domain-containing protein
MLAKDIMTKDVITVRKETPTKEIAKLLLENRITGVPVVDNANRVIGIVSESNLLYKVEPMSPTSTYWQEPKRFKAEHWKIIASNAAEIMTPDVITADEDTPVEELATLMLEKHIKRVPIVEGKKLVGIVTRADIIKAILESPAVSEVRW